MNKTVKDLEVMDGKTLLSMEIDPPKFIISRILPAGLHLLAGSPKIGKSWLSLWLCNQVSKGLPVWEFETAKSSTLYLSLEDTIDRLHFRLSRITDESTEQTMFATESSDITNGLIEQLETFLVKYPDTSLIIIDTFQRIRDSENDKNAYRSDYDEVRKLKAVADRHKIAMVLVHHLRKMPDNDPINMISGSTGIAGAVDGIFILEKDNRMDNKAKLHITGRDIEDLQILLEFDRDNSLWNFVSYLNNPTVTNEKIVKAVAEFMADRKEWKGISTALLEELRKIDSTIETRPNILTRVLKEEVLTMSQRYEITIEYKRAKSARQITLRKKVTVTA